MSSSETDPVVKPDNTHVTDVDDGGVATPDNTHVTEEPA